MSEKPFYITDTGLGLDTESDEMYSFGDEEDFCRLFDKLNEQQATISQLKEENVQLQKENKRLKERNDELEDELEESSAFIIEQREENKQLKEQVQILKKEVRDLLHLCDVCDIQSHLSDECEEVLNDE